MMKDEVKVIKTANVNFEERADYIRFESQDDIIEIMPASWVMKITEKDTGDEYSNDFENKKDAREAMLTEIKSLKDENGDDDE